MGRFAKAIVTVGIVGALSCGMGAAMMGCSSQEQTTAPTADQRVSAAYDAHQGRYQITGSHGCYGCHGANESASPMLAGAPAIPAFHYEGGTVGTSFDDLQDTYSDCATCHVELTGVQTPNAAAESSDAAEDTATASDTSESDAASTTSDVADSSADAADDSTADTADGSSADASATNSSSATQA